jgi:lysophospholipase L1-like esterase
MKKELWCCGWLLLAAVAAPGAGLRNPQVRSGLELAAQAGTVVVAPGECELGGRSVKVAAATTLPVAPGPIVSVTNDPPYRLSADKPQGFAKGTRLRGPNARDVNACGSLVPGSLELRAQDGALLKPGEDYLLDAAWGHLGIGPHSRVTTNDAVTATYRYALLRMDTVQVSAAGKVSLKAGVAHISSPVPPAADDGCLALAHVFVNYRDTAVHQDQLHVIAETPAQAVTASTPGRIPKTLALLKAGQPVTIVCWGDSVTAGGNASTPDKRYVEVFAAGLRERFPQAQLTVTNISAGGSRSANWLFPEKFPYRTLRGAASPCQFQRILDAKPDLVTIEFVNDAGLTPAQVEETYSDILKRLRPLGAEVVLITPHYTMLKMMGFANMTEQDRRPYVLALRQFANKHNVGLADASARWEHLWKEGLPYVTLLNNTINHPDDRGHRLFAEELWKCFQ